MPWKKWTHGKRLFLDKSEGSSSNQAHESDLYFDSPNKKHFYALKCRGDQEDSSDVFTCMLQIFFIWLIIY